MGLFGLNSYERWLKFHKTGKYVNFDYKVKKIVVIMTNGEKYVLLNWDKSCNDTIFWTNSNEDEHIVYCHAIRYEGDVHSFFYDNGKRKIESYGLMYGTKFVEDYTAQVDSYDRQLRVFREKCKGGVFELYGEKRGFTKIVEHAILGKCYLSDEDIVKIKKGENKIQDIAENFIITLELEYEIWPNPLLTGRSSPFIVDFTINNSGEMTEKIKQSLKEIGKKLIVNM